MAGIRITGMASGLPPNIVEQLMDAERIPVQQMEVNRGKQEEKLKLVQELETKVQDITKHLSDLTSRNGFVDRKFTSSDDNVISGQVDPNVAVPGDHSLEVVQLAESPGAVTNSFPDKDKTTLGVGYLKFETEQGTKEVYINSKTSTLEGIANAINNSEIGVKAQVLEDRKDPENPFKLLISGLSTGKDNEIKFPKIYLLDGDEDLFFEKSRASKNAIVKVDGFEVELTNNASSDLIPGVALDLKSAAPGRVIKMKIQDIVEAISGKIKNFVDAYNAALEFIQKQSRLTPGKNGNPSLGPLGGDGMLRSVESSLRRIVLNPQVGLEGTPISRLSQLGIEFNKNGTLNFAQDKFNKVIAENPRGVSAFIRGDGFKTGFATTLKREITNLLDGQFGTISNRKRGIESRIKQTNTRIENKERQLEKKEMSLRKKFADLETKMSDLASQNARVAALQTQGA